MKIQLRGILPQEEKMEMEELMMVAFETASGSGSFGSLFISLIT